MAFTFLHNYSLSQDQYSQDQHFWFHLLGHKLEIKNVLKIAILEDLEQQKSKISKRLYTWTHWGTYSASQSPIHGVLTLYVIADESGPLDLIKMPGQPYFP